MGVSVFSCIRAIRALTCFCFIPLLIFFMERAKDDAATGVDGTGDVGDFGGTLDRAYPVAEDPVLTEEARVALLQLCGGADFPPVLGKSPAGDVKYPPYGK